MRRMLDLFSGRWGWSKSFSRRGWHCIGLDLVRPPEIPEGCEFWNVDVLTMRVDKNWFCLRRTDKVWGSQYLTVRCNDFDFICASSPCEQFSVHGMKHFHPNPPYPELGIKLFEHTRRICEESRVPYVMENVRAAEKFVGRAAHHCGPFYLWGTGVPPLMPKGIIKGMKLGGGIEFKSMDREQRRLHRKAIPMCSTSSGSDARKMLTAAAATIPPELANCVADYAERLIEQRVTV